MTTLSGAAEQSMIREYRAGKSFGQIAGRHNISTAYAHKKLTSMGIHKVYQYRLSEKEKAHIQMALQQGQTFKQIGAELKRQPLTIARYARIEGLYTPINRPAKISRYLDPFTLRRLQNDYESLKITRDELAKKYNISVPSVGRLARRHQWKGRTSDTNLVRYRADKFIRKWYKYDNLSTNQIARRLKRRFPWSSSEYVRERLIAMGIPRRSKGSKNVTYEYYRYSQFDQPRLRAKEINKFIFENYDRMNLQIMSRELGIDPQTIQRRAKMLGIQVSTRRKWD